MFKKVSKFLLIMLAILVFSSSYLMCFAHEDNENTNIITLTKNAEETSSTTEETLTDKEIHKGDLYLFNSNIILDKYVDGNVFLFGNNIEISGQINGNLFVFGNNIKFNNSIVRHSIFACGNSIYYDGCSGTQYDPGNLYVAARDFKSTYNSLVTRNLKVIASNIILRAAIYGDADLICNNIDFGSGETIPIVVGNLNYTANKEFSIPDGVLVGDGTINYTPTFGIENLLISLGTFIVTVLSLYIILNKLTPKFIEKVNNNNFSFITLFKALGIGLATIAIVILFIVLLAGTMVGITLATILALLFIILFIAAPPILTIKITNALKNKLKIEKASIFYIVLVLISIILYSITIIPFIGGILDLLITITAIGLIVNVFLPHKELSEEKKLAIQQTKENKEKRKQEKLDAKAAKKLEKLETKKKDIENK